MASEWSVTLTIDAGVAIALIAAFAAGYAIHTVRALPSGGRDPLSGLFQRERLASSIRQTALLHGGTRRIEQAGGAMLRGRIDHIAQVETIWGRAARDNAARMVAGVMRANLRATDQFREIKGDGFVILVPQADERQASGIARRLRGSLARTRIDGLGPDIRVTASFGVAGRASGESIATLRARADSALTAACRAGEDHIVAASDIEEVLLLPPPARIEAVGSAEGEPLDHNEHARAA